MFRCLQLAQNGAGEVAPNPMVGSVLVYNDIVIGEGFHQKFGEGHAEVNCINSVSNVNKLNICNSTLYVSLEPCSHFGKTPPCVDLIIKNKIKKVVIACIDNFSKVNGLGIKKLKAAGIIVVTGVLENKAIELNKRFFTFHKKQRPYIILKWAQTANSKIGYIQNKRMFISSEITNRIVHQWRAYEAAILIGTNTAYKDNPLLTTRYYNGNNPIRIVIDMDLKLSTALKIFDSAATTLVFNKIKNDEILNIKYLKINFEKDIISQILNVLFKLNILSIIIEGGAITIQSFINQNLWDEARVICNENIVDSNAIHAPSLKNEKLVSTKKIGMDNVFYYKNNF